MKKVGVLYREEIIRNTNSKHYKKHKFEKGSKDFIAVMKQDWTMELMKTKDGKLGALYYEEIIRSTNLERDWRLYCGYETRVDDVTYG